MDEFGEMFIVVFVAVCVCAAAFLIGLPVHSEIILESRIKTNNAEIHLDGIIYNIRIDTAKTDSLRNGWKNEN